MAGAMRQLKLVQGAPDVGFGCSPHDEARSVFEYWLFMFGKNPQRCKLGPARRQAIHSALTLYDAATLMLAVDGMAADPLETCSDQMREAMRDIEWLLAKESRIERWADAGEALRQRAAAHWADPVPSPQPPSAESAAEAAKARESLRLMALQLRSAYR